MGNKKQSTNKVAVALKLPKRIADLIIRAQAIHDVMAANSKTLPSPSPVLSVLQTDIDALKAKETVVKTRVAGAVTDRDAALKVVTVDLNNERAYVEQLCNADPANAAQLAQDAGMTLRQNGARNKPPLSVKPGTVSGEVLAVAKAAKGAGANEWQYSTDGGKTWIAVPSTTRASTTISNLSPGTSLLVRQRALTKAGLGDWTDPVAHIVV